MNKYGRIIIVKMAPGVDMGGVYVTVYLCAVFKLPDNTPVPTPLVIYRKLPYRNNLYYGIYSKWPIL